MAAPQPRAAPHHRFITGNILSRMLQLEKQSKQGRDTTVSATITTTGQAKTTRPQTTILSVQTALSSHPPAAPVRKSHTTPMLSAETNRPNLNRSESKNSTAATVVDDEPKRDLEICLSPSWSEFGANRKKKEKKRWERAKKDHDKKQKSAEEIKAAKRLSKKPPAAMDTQKSSSRRRRNSAISFTSSRSSSQEDSRRSWRGEKERPDNSDRSSAQHRSQSNPATGTDVPPEPRSKPGYWTGSAAPQLPRLETTPKLDTLAWHTRDSSAGTGNSNFSAGDRAYEKSLVDFAYRLEASTSTTTTTTTTTTSMDLRKPAPSRRMDFPASRRSENPVFIRSQTMPDLMDMEKKRPTDIKLGQRAGFQGNIARTDNHFNGQSGPRVVHRPLQSAVPTSAKVTSPESHEPYTFEESMRNHPIPVQNIHPRMPAPSTKVPPSQLPKDGSSYVHKQRMHQQQLSIASYQDEQAVKDANEQSDPEALIEDGSMEKEGPSLETSVSVSSESSRGPTRQTSLECECKEDHAGEPAKPVEPDESLWKEPRDSAMLDPKPVNQAISKESRDAAVLSQTPVTPTSKTGGILSFRPFLRKTKSPGSPPKSSVSAATPTETVVPSPKSPRLTRSGFSFHKPSKSDRMSIFATPQQAERAGPQPVQSESAQPLEKERPMVQADSRTRISSPQARSDGTSSNKHLRRPSTAPSLPSTETQAYMASRLSPQEKVPAFTSPVGNPSPEDTSSKPADESKPEVVPLVLNSPAVIVEGITGEGLVRQASIKRPRSNPMLQRLSQPSSQLPSLDFLPELKHQPLIKPKRISPLIPQFPGSLEKGAFPAKMPMLITSSPLAQSDSGSSSSTNPKELNLTPRSPLRLESHHPSSDGPLLRPGLTSRRRTMSPGMNASRPATMGPLSFGRGGTAEGLEAKPVAKLFVICCKCKFWHDLPSKLYELMALPQRLSRRDGSEGEGGEGALEKATLDTMVKCPWCEHYMTTWCCAGWTTVVYLHERHH